MDDIIDCYPKCQGIKVFKKFIEEAPDYITVFEALRHMKVLSGIESILLTDNNYINSAYIIKMPKILENLQKKLEKARNTP